MCRFVAYLGESVILDEVLFQPDSSIVEQAVHPQLLAAMNLAGFGVVAWDDGSRSPEIPWTYRTAGLPFFDRNLRALSHKARATALLGHVRGVKLSAREVVNEQNVHPFSYDGIPIALAMNGDLDRFAEMRVDVAHLVDPEIAKLVEGTTDSEWFYALMLTQLRNPYAPRADPEELAEAVQKALSLIREVRERRGFEKQSAVNVVVSDGRCLVATRFAFDYGWYHDKWTFAGGERRYDYTTLWYAAGTGYGRHDGEWGIGAGSPSTSLIVASEPLTHDRSAWLEAPEYSLFVAAPGEDGLDIEIRELDA
jgi:predicted glutamine amidotransferase